MCMHRARRRAPAVCMQATKSQLDAESDARLMDALFGESEAEEEVVEKDPTVTSHLQLDYDEDGQPTQLRFAYVDEAECIGCTYCAQVARNTFTMEEHGGRAPRGTRSTRR